MGTFASGTVLQDRYHIRETIGVGGMSEVYRAEDVRLKKEWAVKALTLPPQDPEAAADQFFLEARILSDLHHPHLPRVIDYFISGGTPCLVMDYIQGETLEERVLGEASFLPEEMVKDLASQLLDVLEFLHRRKPPIIVRDLKPANILLESGCVVKLIDFGIAKGHTGGTATQPFAKGYGSSGYAPPEQYGQGDTDARSDIYAFGGTLYFALTKQPPPDAMSLALGQSAMTPISRLRPDLPPFWGKVVERCLRPRPDERFQTVEEIRSAIFPQSPASESTQPRPVPQPPDAELLKRRFIMALHRQFVKELHWHDLLEYGRYRPEFSLAGELFDLFLNRGFLRDAILLFKVYQILNGESLSDLGGALELFLSKQAGRGVFFRDYYFFPAGITSRPDSVLLESAQAMTRKIGMGNWSIVIPIDLTERTIWDSHVPERFRNSNNLGDPILNVKLVLNGLI